MDILIWLIATILGSTWRVTVKDPHSLAPFNDHGKGRIYSFWHAHLLPLTYIFRNTDKSAVVSKSKDGRIAAAVAQRWKHEIIFGSSSRGGTSVLRNCEQQLKEGHCICITPDGPRGPREKVKDGVAHISLKTPAPVIVVKLRVDRCWQLRSWDRMIIPKPFSRIIVSLEKPIHPPENVTMTDTIIEKLRKTIEESMSNNEPVA